MTFGGSILVSPAISRGEQRLVFNFGERLCAGESAVAGANRISSARGRPFCSSPTGAISFPGGLRSQPNFGGIHSHADHPRQFAPARSRPEGAHHPQ